MYGKKLLMHNSDVEYIYDGSLHGLYTCIYESVYRYEKPQAITAESIHQPSLFKQYYIETDIDKAKRVRSSIIEHISEEAKALIEDMFLSYVPNREWLILDFVVLGYELGHCVTTMLAHKKVAPLVHAQKHLLNEAHLLKGFIRFICYENILVATITPKNFVLPHLITHFVDRYKNEHFLIFDETHKVALLYKNKKSKLITIEDISFFTPYKDEKNYQKLWKLFFEKIGIQERQNYKRQISHMPKRYWKNMTEM